MFDLPQTITTVTDVAEQVRLKKEQGFRGIKLQLSAGLTLPGLSVELDWNWLDNHHTVKIINSNSY